MPSVVKGENEEYMAFARRAIAAAGERVADGDASSLRELADLHAAVDAALAEAVARLRNGPYPHSWAQIGRALGITRHAAMQRWPEAGGARRPGGQPAHLR